MTLHVEYTRRAQKDGRKLDREVRERIVASIDRYAETGEGDVKPLSGAYEGMWRLRAGDWRVIYVPDVDERKMEVRRILPREDAYRVRERPEEYEEAAA